MQTGEKGETGAQNGYRKGLKGCRRPGREKEGKNGEDAKRIRRAKKGQSGDAQEAVRRAMHGEGWRIGGKWGKEGKRGKRGGIGISCKAFIYMNDVQIYER